MAAVTDTYTIRHKLELINERTDQVQEYTASEPGDSFEDMLEVEDALTDFQKLQIQKQRGKIAGAGPKK